MVALRRLALGRDVSVSAVPSLDGESVRLTAVGGESKILISGHGLSSKEEREDDEVEE